MHTVSSTLGRWAPLALVGLFVVVVGCEADPIVIKNGVPGIGAVGPVTVDGTVATVVFYVRDYEDDPVDVTMVADVGGQATDIVHAAGSEGLNGLSSSFEGVGALHIVKWDISDLGASAQVTLSLTPDDNEAGTGETVTVGPFSLSEGLGETIVTE